MWELVPQSGTEHGSLHWSLGPWTTWEVSPHTLGDCNGSQASSEAPLELRHGVAAVILLWLKCGLLVMIPHTPGKHRASPLCVSSGV